MTEEFVPPPMWASPKYADRAEKMREFMRTRPGRVFTLIEEVGDPAAHQTPADPVKAATFRTVRMQPGEWVREHPGDHLARIYRWRGLLDPDGQGVTGPETLREEWRP